MHEFGVTNEDLAEVAVTHRYHATLNPDSVMGNKGEITVDDVLGSRYDLRAAAPARLRARQRRRLRHRHHLGRWRDQDCRKQPVWILGGAEADVHRLLHDDQRPLVPARTGTAVRRSATSAFGLAGVTRDDIDVAGLYDCFTITMLRDLEELGFCKLGEGADYFAGGPHAAGRRRCRRNTDGGLLSNSHNVSPSGMHTIEVVRQLRGECGERQVPDAKIGALARAGDVRRTGMPPP